MNKARFTLPLVLAACCLVSSGVWAAEGKGSFTLNPFASKKKPASKALGDDSPGATTIPSAGGAAAPAAKATKTAAQPSTWQKFNSGTQTFFTNTKNVLMPWGKSKPAKPAPLKTGTTKAYSGSALGQKPAKKSMFGNMFGSAEKKEGPATVEDFIGQPRPPF